MTATVSLKARIRMSLRQFALLFLVVAAFVVPAAGKDEGRKNGPLVVYGDTFMFVIQEPDGWTADIENAAKLSAGVVLVRKGETFEKHGALIAIRVAKKVDENTKEDLAHDMREFRNLYPDVQFKDLKVAHPAYASHAKLFAIPKSRHDYVAYLNPGAGTPILFSVTMTTGKQPAGKKDLKAYRDVVASLEFIPQDGAAAPR